MNANYETIPPKKSEGFKVQKLILSEIDPCPKLSRDIASQAFPEDQLHFRCQAREKLYQNTLVLEGINQIFQQALTCRTETELSRRCLAMASELTQSPFGLIADVNQQTGRLENIVSNDPEFFEYWAGLGNGALAGFAIYDMVLLKGKSFFNNDPDRLFMRYRQMPGDQSPITAFLCVPLNLGDKTVGIVAVANREGGYRDADLETLETLARSILQALISKHAEEALRESENKLRGIFDNTSDPILIHDMQGRMVEVNESACKRLGYARDELLQITVEELDSPEFSRVFRKNLQALLRKGHMVFESAHRRKDGTQVPVEINSCVIEYGGRPCVLSVARDISERKQAEANQALQTRILKILNGGGDLHPLIDAALNLIQQASGCDAVGLRLRRGSGYPYFEQNGFAEDFLRRENNLCSRKSRDGPASCEGEGQPMLECTCGLVLSGQADLSLPFFTEAGSFWTNASSELLTLPREEDPRNNPRNRCIYAGYESVGLFPVKTGPEIIGLLQLNNRRAGHFTPESIAFYETLAQNIGLALQRTAAEEALRQNEAHLSAILEQLPIAVGVFNTEGRSILSNSIMRQYTPREMMLSYDPKGRGALKSIGLDGNVLTPDQWPGPRALRGETVSPVEFYFLNEKGQGRSILCSAVPFRSSAGDVIGAIIIAQDITELKKAREELLELTATLEQRVAERTELAEARSIKLQALSVELIEAEERERRRVAQILHEDLQQILAAARFQLQAANDRSSIESTLTNVERLLEESIIKSRHLSHELSPPVLYQSGLFAALKWLTEQMEQKFGLHVRLQKFGEEKFESATLRVFIFRAVQELLFNIVKHAEVKSATVSFTQSGTNLVVTVGDKGKGFDPAVLDSITGRSGLGLLSLRERASYIGGSLQIDSSLGHGSRFILTLPLELKKTDDASMPEFAFNLDRLPKLSKTHPTGIRVLFADDHQVMRQGLIHLVSGQSDIQVVGEAANGYEAVEQTRRLKPDVVVMDVSMPEMDGIEATRHIKAEMPEVRVIGLSMHEDEHISKTMLNAGAESFMSKTASQAELLKAICGHGADKSTDSIEGASNAMAKPDVL